MMTASDWDRTEHFKREEFDSPDAPGSGDKMEPSIVAVLEHIRDRVGEPLTVLSGYRTKAHNKKVGGKANSAHTRGFAVDIKCLDAALRWKIVDAAWYEGIRRIGVYVLEGFIHLDTDKSLPQGVVWGPERKK